MISTKMFINYNDKYFLMKKVFVFWILMTLSGDIYAQNQMYLRAYNKDNKRIGQGYFIELNDTFLLLVKSPVPVTDIHYIRNKTSCGNSICVGSVSGVLLGATFSSLFEYGLEAYAADILGSAAIGGALGAFSCIFKNSKKFEVNGNAVEIRNAIDALYRKGNETPPDYYRNKSSKTTGL